MKTISLICAMLFVISAEAWNGPEENKTVAELEAMEQHELAFEANGPCALYATFGARIKEIGITKPSVAKRMMGKIESKLQEAVDYFQAVGRIATNKNGGREAEWYRRMKRGFLFTDAGECRRAWTKEWEGRIDY